MRTIILAVVLSAALLTAAVPGAAQDFRVLRDRRPFDPDVKPPAALLSTATAAPRVLIAGDSWAQYMWDDGSHQDIFDKFGHADKLVLSRSLDADPGPGYSGPEYAVSGSEARQWVDTANYPWIANMVADLAANPSIDIVMLSLGGNDVLAGRSDGGWYKDMDLDTPGSEAALFDRIHDDTFTVIDAALSVRPGIKVLLASYDYPNFNVGFWCFVYACPKRRDLSRDPTNDLITDQELNAMMVTVEGHRIDWVNSEPRLLFDHSVGLMHYFYGDGVSAPGVLPYPGQTPPAFLPFPGGNPLLPTLRSNFRLASGIDADPIHLDYEGYQYKITNQTETTFFPAFRGDVTGTFFSQGGGRDGWTDGTATGSGAVRVGDSGTGVVRGLLSFDTASIPDGAVISGAAVYLHRAALTGANPFQTGALGLPTVDVVRGSFGSPAVEASDFSAAPDVADAGELVGSARADGYAIRVQLSAAALAAINDQGLTQLRISFPASDGGGADLVDFATGDATAPVTTAMPTLSDYMGTAAPFLDVTYEVTTGIADGDPAGSRFGRASPNPFSASTSIPFRLPRAESVRIRVFDVAGRAVATLHDGLLSEGSHHAVWDGRDDHGRRMPAGLYMARLETAETATVTRMVLLPR